MQESHSTGLDAASFNVNLWSELEAVNPFSEIPLVQAGMKALLKIITPDKSGN